MKDRPALFLAAPWLHGNVGMMGESGDYLSPRGDGYPATSRLTPAADPPDQYDAVLFSRALWRRGDEKSLIGKVIKYDLRAGGFLIFEWVEGADRILADILAILPETDGIQHVASVGGVSVLVWQRPPKGHVFGPRPWPRPQKQETKRALIVRFGAIGDLLMASCVFDALKAEGFDIDFMGLRNADEIFVHDKRVRNIYCVPKQLSEKRKQLYEVWFPQYERVIDFNEAVEGALLKREQSADYYWPDEQRRAQCNRSYLANHFSLAGLPLPAKYDTAFRPSDDERLGAEDVVSAPFILWAIRGSAVHKWTPWADSVIARLLQAFPQHEIYLTGDDTSRRMAEQIVSSVSQWTHNAINRVKLMLNHDLREVLTIAQYADLVIGPETGVLNSVATTDIPKVALLSHSSAVNLTNDWANCVALAPVNTPCYPCHRLHMDFAHCHKAPDQSSALCAFNISADAIVAAAEKAMRIKRASDQKAGVQ